MTAAPASKILWQQVITLATVQAIISLMWVIYGAYMPDLFGQMGLPGEAIALLFMVESGIAIVVHPIAGSLSDRSLHWLGTRFPIIASGVVAAATLFVLIPALAIAGGAAFRWSIIFLLVAWSIAMTLFHSPIVSLLFIYSSVPQLPLVASCLIFAQQLVGLAKPWVEQGLLTLGPLVTFWVASMVLLGAAFVLRRITPPAAPVVQMRSPGWRPLTFIGLAGLTIGWGTRLVMGNIPRFLLSLQSDFNGDRLMFFFALGLAAATLPAGWLARTIGNRPILILGLATTIILSLLLMVPSAGLRMICAGLLTLSLSSIFNGAFPFALTHVPGERAGLGIGMYLAGISAAAVSFGWIIPAPEALAPEFLAIVGAIALGLCIGCVVLTPDPPGPLES
ncbi:MAG: MFS transporter [Leptolyngbya sp. DLM2.Bin15]|nr:MAG: MFS transporter [Leptolyngbya sp. DLM2.Bin15]